MTTLHRTLLCVAAALGGLTASVSAQNYTLTDLGNPTPEASDLFPRINNQGTIVVTSSLTGGYSGDEGGLYGQGGDQVHVYQNGSFTRLPILDPTLPSMRAVAINNANQVAGWSSDDDAVNRSTAWIYEIATGTLRNLNTETNHEAWGFTFDINDAGVTIGSNYIDWNGAAWVYDGTDVVFMDDILPTEKLYFDINNENQLLGLHFDDQYGFFIYTLGTGTVENISGDLETDFLVLNDAGVAAGVRWSDGLLAVYSNGSTQYYPVPHGSVPGAGFGVSDINDDGWVVGAYSVANSHQGVVFNGSEVLRLNALVVNGYPWVIESATGINDQGQIVGKMRAPNGDLHVYRLDPIDGITSNGPWQNVAIEPQYGTFTLNYDAVPSAVGIDAVTGLARTPADWYTDLAPIVRFAPSGRIDARNGGGYQALNVLNYHAGVTYHISMTVDLWAKRFSATVTPEGGSPVVIATDFAFRPEQARANELKYLALQSSGGHLTVSNIALADSGSNAIFSAGTWENVDLGAHGSSFTVAYDVTPSRANLDAVTGLSNGPADWFDDLAPIVRFAPSGFIDARNGGAYQAANTVPYAAGVKYHVELDVNLATRTYSATVTPAGGSAVTVANNYAFRLEQSSVSALTHFVLFSSGGGGTEVTDLEVD